MTKELPSNPILWRTHASVLKKNYLVTERVEKTSNTLVRKYYLGEIEVMEDRVIANISDDGASCDMQTYSQALGSFRGDLGRNIYTITREQYEFLKEIWK